ncbi:GtrA family protein [Nostocaceae cyanobacterium CENA369]|uniref:GtrA family protein n=1 Tax=Dendronalium phyllosphericum CENA369 TaxID=1725256 RepID=A0A8J7IF98_9NOST|nr:GtrA family protein [Dendronalium phyllosphericum]MBH8578103.1 GtrA family protein [Dendronalium phyllosphericum CENA369]
MKSQASLSTYSAVFSRFTRFAIVGLSGVFVDLGMFYFLHSSLGLALTISAMLSTEIAIINNFIWNDLWTFNDVSLQPNISQKLQRFVKFNLICLVGLILNSLIVSLLFYKFQVNEYIAKLIAIACVTLWNFWLNLKINWQLTNKTVDVVVDI